MSSRRGSGLVSRGTQGSAGGRSPRGPGCAGAALCWGDHAFLRALPSAPWTQRLQPGCGEQALVPLVLPRGSVLGPRALFLPRMQSALGSSGAPCPPRAVASGCLGLPHSWLCPSPRLVLRPGLSSDRAPGRPHGPRLSGILFVLPAVQCLFQEGGSVVSQVPRRGQKHRRLALV